MSALPSSAMHALEPPIPRSSVPRCPCQFVEPCPCERYGHKLEQRQRSDQITMITAARTLGLIAAMEDVPTDVRQSILNVSMQLL